MLTDEQIELNKQRFKELLIATNREGISNLLDYLETTDFYTAPASTRYHGAYKGGLCQHSLDVYEILKSEINNLGITRYEHNEIEIVALLHDLAKTNTYEYVEFAKKVKGSWYPGYVTKDLDERFIAGNHEETSCFIARSFVPLSVEEDVAISHHQGGIGWDTIPYQAMSDIYKKFPLTLLLYTADMQAAFLKA